MRYGRGSLRAGLRPLVLGRLANGGMVLASVTCALEIVEGRGLKWYASSQKARRGFCRECGTPLTFEFSDDEATRMDLTIGSFDEPGRFRPVHHFAIESRHGAWLATRDLPGIRSEDNPSTHDRWMKTVGKLPD